MTATATPADASRLPLRVGVVVPRSNTTCEDEFARLATSSLAFHFTRMRFKAGERDPDPAVQFGTILREPLLDLAACDVDLLALGCTTVSMACGNVLLDRLSTELLGAPGVYVSDAMLAAFRRLNVKRLAVFTPYTDETNAEIARFLESNGLTITAMQRLGLNDTAERFKAVSRLPGDVLLAQIRKLDLTGADCLLLSCTDMPTLDLIEQLEAETGLPVISSNLALFRQVVDRLGAVAPAPGRLFADTAKAPVTV
jgi:arylmalonate decarboxylase